MSEVKLIIQNIDMLTAALGYLRNGYIDPNFTDTQHRLNLLGFIERTQSDLLKLAASEMKAG